MQQLIEHFCKIQFLANDVNLTLLKVFKQSYVYDSYQSTSSPSHYLQHSCISLVFTSGASNSKYIFFILSQNGIVRTLQYFFLFPVL